MKTIEVNLQNIHDIYNEFNIKTVNDDFENYVLKQKKFYILGAVLFLIGCLFLIPIHFLHAYNAPEVVGVIFEIITWVFIWEFVECVTFRPFNERIRKGRVDKILKGEIFSNEN